MLRYLGSGKRPYGDYPMPVHERMNWEFQAVLIGKMAPTTPEHNQLESKTLWLFPPGCGHGWRGEKGKLLETVVFHYSTVPESVERLAAARGYLKVKLRSIDIVRLRHLAKTLHLHYWQPMLVSDIHTQSALVDLCLLITREYKEARAPRQQGAAFTKVTMAEEWALKNLVKRPKIEDMARAVGLSVSQLDRLFGKIRGESPSELLARFRIQRAMHLLANAQLKLDDVAAQSGFSSASNLCRAFREAKHVSPSQWRRETLIRYKKPHAERAEHVVAHGRRDRRGF